MNLKLCFLSGLFASSAFGGQILWSLPLGGDYTFSNGDELSDGYVFQLGVFEADFVPSAANVAQWRDEWNGLAVGRYLAEFSGLSEDFIFLENDGPFQFGVQFYAMGFQVTPAGTTEVFLATDSSWTIPAAGAFFPVLFDLDEAGQVIVGTADGANNAIQCASLPAADMPGRAYDFWTLEHFTPSERTQSAISGTDADADGDGVVNLLEYAFGSDPQNPLDSGSVVDLSISSGDVMLSVDIDSTSLANFSYEMSPNLLPDSWTDIGGTLDLSEETFSQTATISLESAFFRFFVDGASGEE